MMQNIQSISGKFHSASFSNIGERASDFYGELHRMIVREGDRDSSGKFAEIGTISEKNPTVSHLLAGSSKYGKECWDIIHSELNRDKPYRKLQIGQRIGIDPETKEIILENTSRNVKNRVAKKDIPAATVHENRKTPGNVAESGLGKLDKALKSYIGTPYSKLDCYELVVEGMKKMGLAYWGKEGIQNHLIKKALGKGLPLNAYLTGEGLIDASSERIFDKTISKVDDPKNGAGEILDELEPVLEPGLIVSFSTGKRGHTGIVSKYGDKWTFLNSGNLDNSVRSGASGKGVGEEDLKSEIENWLRLAGRRGNSLKIVFGKLVPEKTMPFVKLSC